MLQESRGPTCLVHPAWCSLVLLAGVLELAAVGLLSSAGVLVLELAAAGLLSSAGALELAAAGLLSSAGALELAAAGLLSLPGLLELAAAGVPRLARASHSCFALLRCCCCLMRMNWSCC